MKTRNWTRLLVLASCLIASGCLEVENEWTLNPDGSGKVKHRVVQKPSLLNMFGGATSARSFGRQVMEESQGVTAWDAPRFSKNEDGHLSFEGTAYFKDAEDLRLNLEVVQTRFRRTKEGALVASLVPNANDPLALPEVLTKGFAGQDMGDLRAALAGVRLQLAAFKSFLKGKDTIHLPGKISAAHAVKGQVVTFDFSVDRVEAMLDALQKDEGLRQAFAARGRGEEVQDEATGKALQELLAKTLAGSGNHEVTSSGGEALFPYEKELAAVRAKNAALYAELGYALPGRPGKPFESLQVAAVNLVHAESANRGMEFLSDFQPHLLLELRGVFGETPLKVLGGRITELRAADGTSLLLPAKDRLVDVKSMGKKGLGCELIGRIRPSLAGGFKRVAGYVEYLLPGSKSREVELGFKELAPKAKGTQFDAKIEAIDATGQGLELRLELTGLSKEEIKAVVLVGADGQARSASPGFGFTFSDKVSLNAEFPVKALPKKSRLVLELYSARTRHRVDFDLRDLDLTGAQR